MLDDIPTRRHSAGHETAVAKSAEGTNKGQVRDSSNPPPVEGEPSTHQGNCLKPLATQWGLRMRVWRPGSAQAMLAGRGQARKSRYGRWRGYSPAATATRTRMEVLTQVHASSQEPLTPSGSAPYPPSSPPGGSSAIITIFASLSDSVLSHINLGT